jgi:hypothetical protein
LGCGIPYSFRVAGREPYARDPGVRDHVDEVLLVELELVEVRLVFFGEFPRLECPSLVLAPEVGDRDVA